MASLSDRLRRIFDDPETRMGEAGVRPGIRVADIGAGTGFFAIAAAKMAGPTGLVFAVEPDRVRAAKIEEASRREGLGNISVLRVRAEDLAGIEDGAVDLIVSMYSIHHVGDWSAAFAEFKRVLAREGRIYIRDRKKGRLNKHGSRARELESWLDVRFAEVAGREEGGRVVVSARRLD